MSEKKPRSSSPKQKSKKTISTEANFPVVGIGASAGGLAAFENFFSGMPADTNIGMAFVLVQHLAPDHKSILSELVSRYTKMKVSEVIDGVEVKPNCAYIIPPNRDMTFLNGKLYLMEPSTPRGQRMPIDFFFRSLAQNQREHAICVVLSGTGSDGTLGVRAIKGEGGMVMVQKPDSAEHDGMPRSVLATGLVDFELDPHDMLKTLMTYVQRAFAHNYKGEIIPSPKEDNAFSKILIILRNQSGSDFSQYKPSTIRRRIERRMAVHQIESLDEYAKFILKNPNECMMLFRDLLIGVTSFFRDKEAFLALQNIAIPRLMADKEAGSVIRVWCPGCSTGEEAYSIAILLQERMDALKKNFKIQLFATDLDSRAIAVARDGLYPISIATDISPERLSRYFMAEPDQNFYRIQKNIRDMLIFSEQNLIKDPPFSKLDLISCRNLLIYMGSELQKRIIPLFHYALNPSGVLFLGTSETLGENVGLFNVLDSKSRIYIKKEYLAQNPAINLFLPPMSPRFTAPNEKRSSIGKLSLRELTEQGIIQHINMAGILVNRDGDIMYLQGHTGMYLEPAQGETGINNILKMAREGLKHILTANLHKSDRSKSVISSQGLKVKTNGHYTFVNLTIKPISISASSPLESLFLVILEETPNVPFEDLEKNLDDDARIIKLKNELRAKEEYLQTANEELETTNEELKSSNEEMQSINEELQSTNEELETSKEELQSVNEELATVNTELQNKVADLSRTNNDMSNLLAGTGIGTIFVDLNLNVLRFTPAAVKIINLILSDIGRPLGHVVTNLVDYDGLLQDTQNVLDTLIPKELEVNTIEGKSFSMRIMPYRTAENIIEGAVMTFLDISSLRQPKQLNHETEIYLNQLFENTSKPMSINQVVLDKENKVIDFAFVKVNSSFEKLFDKPNGQLMGYLASKVLSYEAVNAQLELYEQTIIKKVPFTNTVKSMVNDTDYSIKVFQVGIGRFLSILNIDEKEGTNQVNLLQRNKKSGE